MTGGQVRQPVSGIVLAGGRSTRFGTDKLAAELGGAPLVHRAVSALAAVVDEVVLVVGPSGVPPLPRNLGVPLRIVRDDEPGAGPLAALRTALGETVHPAALVVAGDMPALVPAVLRLLADTIGGPAAEASVLCEGETVRPLPLALACDPALGAVRTVRAAGGSSIRALLDALAVARIPESAWRPLDPSGATLLDVDRPEDLERAGDLR
jgi:molybdopterin-guanine dinucleotide biosynthesis protein A